MIDGPFMVLGSAQGKLLIDLSKYGLEFHGPLQSPGGTTGPVLRLESVTVNIGGAALIAGSPLHHYVLWTVPPPDFLLTLINNLPAQILTSCLEERYCVPPDSGPHLMHRWPQESISAFLPPPPLVF